MQRNLNRCLRLLVLLLAISIASSASAAPPQDYTVPDLRAHWHALLPVFVGDDYDAKSDRFSINEIPVAGLAVDKQGASYAVCFVYTGDAGKRKRQCVLVKYDARGKRAWDRAIGDEDAPVGSIQVAVDARNNVYLAGWMETRAGAAFSYGGFAVSYTPQGRLRWNHATDVKDIHNNSQYWGLTVDNNSVYLVGSASQRAREEISLLLTRLTLDGKQVWSQKYDGQPKERRSRNLGVTVTPSGMVCVIGNAEFENLPRNNVNPLGQVGFVMAVDGRGKELWTTQLGPNANARGLGNRMYSVARSIAHDKDGNLYVIGATGALGGVRPIRPGVPGAPGAGQNNVSGAFLAKLSPRGQVLWTHAFGDMHQDLNRQFTPHRVRVAASGEVFVYGPWDNRPTLLKIDADGKLLNIARFANWEMYNASDFDFTPDGKQAVIHGQYHPGPGTAANAGLFRDGAAPQNPTRRVIAPHYFVAQVDLDAPEPDAP